MFKKVYDFIIKNKSIFFYFTSTLVSSEEEVDGLKSTGVIRKIDELGRIVVPKEIRRNLRIRDGENLEIFIEEESIVLKKVSKIEDFKYLADLVCEQVFNNLNLNIAITDREKVISAKGETLEKINNYSLENNLINLIDNREIMSSNELVNLTFNNTLISGYFSISPLITSLDSLGLVIIYSDNQQKNDILNIAKLISGIVVSNIDVA